MIGKLSTQFVYGQGVWRYYFTLNYQRTKSSIVSIILLLNTIVSFGVDQSIFYSMSVHGLRILTVAEKDILTKAFIEELESFTVQDDTTGFCDRQYAVSVIRFLWNRNGVVL